MEKGEEMKRRPEYQTQIAKERISILFKEAEKTVKEDPQLARRYVQLAKRIAMRYNVRLGRQRRKYCKYCNTYFIYGLTARKRLKNGKINVKCLSCNKVIRYPYR